MCGGGALFIYHFLSSILYWLRGACELLSPSHTRLYIWRARWVPMGFPTVLPEKPQTESKRCTVRTVAKGLPCQKARSAAIPGVDSCEGQ